MKMKKILFWITFAMTVLIISGCGSDTTEEDTSSAPDQEMTEEAEENDASVDTNEADETFVSEGIYKEKIDDETIEVQIGDEIKTFTLSEEAEKEADKLTSGERISFMYHHHEHHDKMESIKGTDYDWQHHHKGNFNYDRHHHHYDHHRDSKGHHRHHHNRDYSE